MLLYLTTILKMRECKQEDRRGRRTYRFRSRDVTLVARQVLAQVLQFVVLLAVHRLVPQNDSHEDSVIQPKPEQGRDVLPLSRRPMFCSELQIFRSDMR